MSYREVPSDGRCALDEKQEEGNSGRGRIREIGQRQSRVHRFLHSERSVTSVHDGQNVDPDTGADVNNRSRGTYDRQITARVHVHAPPQTGRAIGSANTVTTTFDGRTPSAKQARGHGTQGRHASVNTDFNK